MFAFFKRSKYRSDFLGCLYALMYFYPRGRDAILKDYPGVEGIIKSNFDEATPHASAAVYAASALLTNIAQTLTADQKQLIVQQIRSVPLSQLKAAIGDAMAAKPIPDGMVFGAILFGNALLISATMATDKEIDKIAAEMLSTEVFGALDGLTSTALPVIHNAARSVWDAAIREAGSIDSMRDMIVPLRNVHFEVIDKLRRECTNKSVALGCAVTLAMVLAVQSEDRALERVAYQAFKQVLWQPGEEPAEFYEHDAVCSYPQSTKDPELTKRTNR